MAAQTLTHKDLAALAGVSVTTIKSYRRKFPEFLPPHAEGKPIRFKPEAGDVCRAIQELFAQGLSVEETRKRLAARFRAVPTAARPAPSRPQAAAAGLGAGDLERLARNMGEMMKGMAALATAQARAEQRLAKVENALLRLAETGRPEAQPARSRKVVVQGKGGDTSYTLQRRPHEEDQAQEERLRPPNAFLDTPVVIQSGRGEFLGLPGALTLRRFVGIILRLTAGSKHSWEEGESAWVLHQKAPGVARTAFFHRTTTPKGNQVILLFRLEESGREQAIEEMQELFRQVKAALE